jgi:hypothetical protein
MTSSRPGTRRRVISPGQARRVHRHRPRRDLLTFGRPTGTEIQAAGEAGGIDRLSTGGAYHAIRKGPGRQGCDRPASSAAWR